MLGNGNREQRDAGQNLARIVLARYAEEGWRTPWLGWRRLIGVRDLSTFDAERAISPPYGGELMRS